MKLASHENGSPAYHLRGELQTAPAYTALSYTWTNDDPIIPVQVNNATVRIRPHLHAALQALRYVSKPRNLWIDAICINQEDPMEKEAQVSLMTKIFQEAAAVIVWLGEADEDVNEAFECIRQHNQNRQGSSQREIYIPFQKEGLATLDQACLYPDQKDFGFRDLCVRHALTTLSGKIFTQPWWSRVWAVQEVAVSRFALIRCGAASIPWQDLVDFVQKFPTWSGPSDVVSVFHAQSPLQRIEGCRKSFSEHISTPVLEMLLNFRQCRSTDPRIKCLQYLG